MRDARGICKCGGREKWKARPPPPLPLKVQLHRILYHYSDRRLHRVCCHRPLIGLAIAFSGFGWCSGVAAREEACAQVRRRLSWLLLARLVHVNVRAAKMFNVMMRRCSESVHDPVLAIQP